MRFLIFNLATLAALAYLVYDGLPATSPSAPPAIAMTQEQPPKAAPAKQVPDALEEIAEEETVSLKTKIERFNEPTILPTDSPEPKITQKIEANDQLALPIQVEEKIKTLSVKAPIAPLEEEKIAKKAEDKPTLSITPKDTKINNAPDFMSTEDRYVSLQNLAQDMEDRYLKTFSK